MLVKVLGLPGKGEKKQAKVYVTREPLCSVWVCFTSETVLLTPKLGLALEAARLAGALSPGGFALRASRR